jgi:cyclopropane fatty-acyl-phospholipid synthase-like methyltransferase
MKNEHEIWTETKEMLQNFKFRFGEHWSFNFRNDPKRLGFVLSRYKFSAKMACRKGGTILELGCSEGIGATILSELAEKYVGVDLDRAAIESAHKNLENPKYSFLYDDFLEKKYGDFNAVISLDVVEHIHPEFEDQYFNTVHKNLTESGICVIGTPNITFAPYASKASQLGHVNLYSQEKLANVMKKYFHTVFSFGMNDEIMHTGFPAMANYLLCVGFDKK